MKQMMCRGKEKFVCEDCELHKVHNEANHCKKVRFCYDVNDSVQCEEIELC